MNAFPETNGATMDGSGTSARVPLRLARSWRYGCPVGLRYTIAVLLVALAWVTTFTLRQSVNAPSFQTPFFVCAIVLSGWIGGFGPGVIATLVSAFAIEYTFTEPRFTFGFTGSEVPKFLVFLLTGVFISWLARRQRRDEEALLVAREGLEEKVQERTTDLYEANRQLTAEVAERTRAEKELQRVNRVLRARSICNHSVNKSVDEAELLQRVCETMVKVGGYRASWVRYTSKEAGVPVASASQDGIPDLEPAWGEGSLGRELAEAAIRSGRAISCERRIDPSNPDLPSEQTVRWAEARAIRSVLALPLIPDGQIIGHIVVYSQEADAFGEKAVELSQQAANDVAQGIVLLRARAARSEAEAALKKTESELARVARLTTMGELTASIAHEINQPLSALVTNANACLRWLAAATPNLEEARTSAQRMVRDGKRAADVIARIRSLLSKGQPLRQRLAIGEVLEEILPLIKGELHRRQATLRLTLAEGLPSVELDRVQIQQVLMNLMVNALDAMNEVSDRPRVLSLRTGIAEGGDLQVEVEDSGVGLNAEQKDRLFDAFYTTKAEGMGMGLSISRSIVEAHGGRLWAEANQGPGATFKFSLPLEGEARP